LNKMFRFTCTFVLALFVIGLTPITNTTATQDQPTLAKDSLQITAFTFNVYKGNYDVWSWVPRMTFRVNGPIASGSQLYVQFSLPTGPWVKFDCETNNTEKGYWWKTECGGRDIPEAQGTLYTGPVTFTIKLRNELQGSDSVRSTFIGFAHSTADAPRLATVCGATELRRRRRRRASAVRSKRPWRTSSVPSSTLRPTRASPNCRAVDEKRGFFSGR